MCILYLYIYVYIIYLKNIFYRCDISKDDTYSQPGQFYRNVLPKDEQNRLIENIVDHLKNAANFLQVLLILIILVTILYI